MALLQGQEEYFSLTKATTDSTQADEKITSTILTVPQVAKILQISHTRAHQLAKDHILPSIRLGKNIRITKSKFLDYCLGNLLTSPPSHYREPLHDISQDIPFASNNLLTRPKKKKASR